MADEREPDVVVDLLGRDRDGALVGLASSDLNATLLGWPPGHEMRVDTNAELGVLLIVLEGGGVATVDEREHALVTGTALLGAKGSSMGAAAADSVGAMKRSEALRALSHQHHQGLFAALQLRRAGRETAAEARQVFLDFYEREGSRHFRAEEELLLPAFARYTRVDDPAIVRALTDHIDIRRRRQDLDASVDPDPVELRELGERLEGHIRFEERVLFPMIEEVVPVEELERLGAAFARAEAEHE